MHTVRFVCVLISLLIMAARARADELEPIVVTGTFVSSPALGVPASISVLDTQTLRGAGQQAFQDVLGLVPNLNWAGDTARPRYFQIRGVGDLEGYQGAPNPSVGFLLDDIDFSGIGGVATLFDLDHIEVLRGPQGTRYGANALGGLIYVKSADPEASPRALFELGGGDYATGHVGGMVTGPVAALDSAFRIAAQYFRSDGFYDNAYLHRDNTDARRELTLRGKWRYEPSDTLRIDLTALRIELNEGYDAFAIDNSRTTQSDHPSADDQRSTGAAAKLAYSGWSAGTLTLIGTFADSTIRYGYDGDWGNPAFWAPFIYDYTEIQHRRRRTHSAEARFANDTNPRLTWLLGAYAFELRERFDDTSVGLFADPADGPPDAPEVKAIASRYRASSGALFAQAGSQFASRWHASLGVRGERRTSGYHDSNQLNQFPLDTQWGGNAALSFEPTADATTYLSVSRGYKASGFNLSQALPPDQVAYGPESALSFELGYKAELLEHRARIESDVFYTRYAAPQLKTSEQIDQNNPNDFVYFTTNAGGARSYGFEGSAVWRVLNPLEAGASLGLLHTRYHRLMDNGVDLPDRSFEHAPRWQAAVNATYRDPRGAFARIDVTGMGAYYFSLPPNATRSHAYGLMHAKAGFERERWAVQLWGRNLLDKRYAVRGFYFGNEPPDFPNKLYLQLGEPRTWGIDVTFRFGAGSPHAAYGSTPAQGER